MEWLFDVDRRAYLILHSRWRASWLDPIMVWATKIGTKGIAWISLAAGLLVGGTAHGRWAGILTVAALLLAEGIINIVLKPIVHRERPFSNRALRKLGHLLVTAPGPHSWPSAHAGSSAAAALTLAYAYPLWAPAFIALAFLVAYSRVYVGVHYPLDVLAGIIVGVISAAATLIIGLQIRPL